MRKTKEKKRNHSYRKGILFAFGICFVILVVGALILHSKVYIDNNKGFTQKIKSKPAEKVEKTLNVYMNATKSWTNNEGSEEYKKATQYEGVIQNNTGKHIREWKLTVYLPQKGQVESVWNAVYEETEDSLIVIPLEFTKEIPAGEQQTFGFIFYSADILNFEHFEITGFYKTHIKEYALFWILLIGSLMWIVCLAVYIWVYFSIRRLEKQRDKDRRIISQTMDIVAYLVDAKNQYTQEHSKNVALYAEEIARRMGMGVEDVRRIRYIALVHDCGKVGVPDTVWNKIGPLNDGERDMIRSHTVLGYNMLQECTALEEIRDGVLYHHEHYDGTGYPKGLKGKKIPMCARIIAVADAYDAMSSDRSYRKHLKREEILKELKENSGKQFDPELVKHMIDMIEDGFVYDVHNPEGKETGRN